MIIRCPDCTTGFKLPNDQVSEDPIKVRCSKCSHIFRVGLVDDEPVLFNEDGERLPDEDQKTRAETEADKKAPAGQTQEGTGFTSDSSPEDQDEGEADQADERAETVDESEIALDDGKDVDTSDTHIGTGAAERPAGRTQDAEEADASDSAEYNPFPHANSDIGPKKSKAITGDDDAADDRADVDAAAAEAADQPVSPETVEAERAKVDDEAFRETQQIDSDDEFEEEPAGQQAEAAAGTANGESYADGGEARDQQQGGGPSDSGAGARQPPAAQAETQQVERAEAQAEAEAEAERREQRQQAPAGQQSQQAQGTADDPQLQTGGQQSGGRAAGGNQQRDYWDKQPADEQYHDEYFDPETGSRQNKDDSDAAAGQADNQSATVTSSPQAGELPNTGTATTGGQAAGGQTAVGQAAGGTTSGGSPNNATQDAAAGSAGSNSPRQTGGGSAKPQTSGGSPGAEPAARQSNSWAVDEVDRVDAHQFGNSGFQKFANFLLIVLVIGAGFLTYVSAQNSWFVDFKKFRQMLQVAFQGAEYEPREEWTEPSQPVQPAPAEDPIEFRNVFAQVSTLGGEDADDEAPRVLVLRGEVKNVSGQNFPNAKVRGLVKDAQGKVLEQQVAPVGAHVAPADIRSLESPDAIEGTLPDAPAELGNQDTQPFTIVFPSVPGYVTEGEPVRYSVEFEPEKDLEPTAADD